MIDLNTLIESMDGHTRGERMNVTQLVILSEINENVKAISETLKQNIAKSVLSKTVSTKKLK